MLRFLFGVLILLHGLVHMWYFVLSQRLVEFKAEMGWSGRSWLLSGFLSESLVRGIASVLYVTITVAFIISTFGFFTRTEWWRTGLVLSSGLSALTVLVFWDGSTQLLVQKGLLGFVISAALLVLLLVFNWPPTNF